MKKEELLPLLDKAQHTQSLKKEVTPQVTSSMKSCTCYYVNCFLNNCFIKIM